MSGDPESLPDLARGLAAGEIDLDAYLDRVLAGLAARDAALRSFLPEPGREERLRRAVASLLAHWPRTEGRPPLFGVPVGIKDVFRVDGLPTGAGSRVPPEELAGHEAEVVARLKAAGALILGKTVSTEFAYYSPGPTRNPHDPERTPGGSSSGSAAAVGAGLCPLALGTQTIGSTLRPAAYCGVVGFKPSFDRVSAAGAVPLAPSFDHVGFFTRDVAGMAFAASVVCAGWRSAAKPATRPRLGIPEGPFLERASTLGLAGFRAACAHLEAAGFAVASIPALADFAEIEARHHRIVAAEAARVHAGLYGRFGPLYSPQFSELVERGRAVSDWELHADLACRTTLRRALDESAERHGIDLWISPAAQGPAPLGLSRTGDPVMNIPWSQAGVPALALPAGRAEGMPLGLQIAGRWHGDEDLLAAAAEIERALTAFNAEAV